MLIVEILERWLIIRLPDRITRQPAPANRIVGPILRQIEPAVGVVEHAGIVEVGEWCGSLQRIAIGVVAVSWRARCAGEDAPHRADLVRAVVIGLRRRARHILAFGKIFARHRVAGITRLADARAAPDVRSRDRAAAARGRRGDTSRRDCCKLLFYTSSYSGFNEI